MSEYKYPTPPDFSTTITGSTSHKWALNWHCSLWHQERDNTWYVTEEIKQGAVSFSANRDIPTDRAHQILEHLGMARALAEEVA